ncbi:hypothetical protein ALI144C_16740 [Actinosynnema sp. ALI-1.44]|uniref:sensor histidine kinase n=1 Tax=Actinosynnema sp. ALI-1.44 TaxID=1933779 RepID=UPI00097C168A|nr:sensor histidine kinase [Actinosynnema sp. ALI-1.44]ONI83151.1 hypothetical protein ALI144C_16740 [Actinosynnema sp. ALI-1.44]
MRTGAGYYHETAFYDSDDSMLGLVLPFLTDGVRAGEPTWVAFTEANERLVRSALPDTSGITFLPGADQYSRPASAIKSYRQMMAEHVARGAAQIRIVGDVPHPGMGVPWEWWSRYEHAANEAFKEFPLWGLCPYDTRITPAAVLADVTRTHPHIAHGNGHHTDNPAYRPSHIPTTTDPIDELELSAPLGELADPSPVEARHAAVKACAGTRLTQARIDDFVFAVNEAVTNAICHGHPPVTLRLWADGSRVMAAVTDHGRGPTDALAGMMPATNSATAGLGLYIMHLTCDYVAFSREGDRFTIRILAKSP